MGDQPASVNLEGQCALSFSSEFLRNVVDVVLEVPKHVFRFA